MGGGYEWAQAPGVSDVSRSLQHYLTSQIGQPGPTYPGTLAPQAPGALMDASAMMKYLLGNLGAGGVGTTGQGFPMPATGRFPGMEYLGDVGEAVRGMWQTGAPTMTKEVEAAQRAAYQQELQDVWSLQKEQSHLGAYGGRYGTGLMRAMSEAGGRGATQFQLGMAGLGQQSAEAARARQMQAMGLGAGLGEAMANIPLQRAMAAGNLGMGMWGMQQNQAMAEYQAWLQRQPGYRPEMSLGMQYVTGQPSFAYQPPGQEFFWNMLQGLGQAGTSWLGRPGG